ncbi:hypothetical protein FKP32DRAFT_323867 [Trametes sanguinea]|nr:hypothetical protein FKP32DRAFT_323867 [Trametes sanguinea]
MVAFKPAACLHYPHLYQRTDRCRESVCSTTPRISTPLGNSRCPREDGYGSRPSFKSYDAGSCAVSCIAPAESQSGCQSGDNFCLCTTAEFLKSTIKCAAESCSGDDANTAINTIDNDCRSILQGDDGEPSTSTTDVSTHTPSAASQTSTPHEQPTPTPTTSPSVPPPTSASSTSEEPSSVRATNTTTPPSATTPSGSMAPAPPSNGNTSTASALPSTSASSAGSSAPSGRAPTMSMLSSPSGTGSVPTISTHPSSSATAISGSATAANAHGTSPTLVIALSVSLGIVVVLALCLVWFLFRRRRRQQNGHHLRTVPYGLPDAPASGNVTTKEEHHESSSGAETVDALSPTATSGPPEERPFEPLSLDAGTGLLHSPTIQSPGTSSSPVLIGSSDMGHLGHAGLNAITPPPSAQRSSVRPLPDPSTSASSRGPLTGPDAMGDDEKPSASLPDGADHRANGSVQPAAQQEMPSFVGERSRGRRRLRMEPVLIEEDFSDEELPPPYEPRA